MALKLVPKSTPTPKEALVLRVKAMHRDPGQIQCKRCGGRTMMTTYTGAWIDPLGKYRRGTLIDDRVCYDCHKQGIFSPMMPELKPVK